MPEYSISSPYLDEQSKTSEEEKQVSARIEPTADMTIDQLMVTFISNAVSKIPNKDQLIKDSEARKQILPRRRGKYVPIATGNRSDFEII
jgi:hypothetical protein